MWWFWQFRYEEINTINITATPHYGCGEIMNKYAKKKKGRGGSIRSNCFEQSKCQLINHPQQIILYPEKELHWRDFWFWLLSVITICMSIWSTNVYFHMCTYNWSWNIIWMLRTELRSSVRIEIAFYYWTIILLVP